MPSRRMTNLLASIVVSTVVGFASHCALSRQGEKLLGAVGESSVGPPTLRVSYAGISPRAAASLTVQAGHEERVRVAIWRRHTTGERTEVTAPAEHAESAESGVDRAELPEGLAASEGGGSGLKELSMGLRAPPDSEREASLLVRLRVREADVDTVTLAWDVRTAEVVGASDAAWDESVERAGAMKGATRLHRSGLPVEASVKGARRGDELAILLGRLMAEPGPVRPEEPLGHGAIWEVEREQTDGGVVTRQTERYEVVDTPPDGLRLRLRESGTLLAGALDRGTALQAFEPTVDRYEAVGRGELAWRTDRIAVEGSVDARTVVQTTLSYGPSTMGLATTTELGLTLTPEP